MNSRKLRSHTSGFLVMALKFLRVDILNVVFIPLWIGIMLLGNPFHHRRLQPGLHGMISLRVGDNFGGPFLLLRNLVLRRFRGFLTIKVIHRWNRKRDLRGKKSSNHPFIEERENRLCIDNIEIKCPRKHGKQSPHRPMHRTPNNVTGNSAYLKHSQADTERTPWIKN